MPLRILVVEDHAPFRRLICAALQRRVGFQTIEAADGLAAIHEAEARQPDLVLLDINLPNMHGFEVAAQVRRIVPNARLLFLSQESSPEIVQEALSLGVHGFVQKIAAASDLMPAIDDILAGRRFVSPGIAYAGTAAPRRHEILFCPDDAAVVDGFARYVAAALNASDAAIALLTNAHRPLLLQALRTQGVDVDGAVERGTCLFFDADVAPDAMRFVDAIDRARAAAADSGKARPRVAFCGERAGRLWAARRTAEAAQLERFCGDLAQDVDILCAYPVPYTTDDQALTHICAEHTAVFAA